MIIPIKINGKKYKVKPINELTTKEFIEMSKIENIDFTKYIAWQTGLKTEDAWFSVMDKKIEKLIGSVPDINKLSFPKKFDKKKIIETVGQRHQVEASNLQGFELLVFCLAVAMARSNNIDEVNRLYNYYMKQSFIEILPAGLFFFKIYKHGKNRDRSFLKKLLYSMMIKK